MTTLIKREVYVFLVVGTLATIVDFAVYSLLTNLGNISFSSAKTISFIAGTLFGYVANKNWTFQYKKKVTNSLVRFFVLYLFTLFINVYFNSTFLTILREVPRNFELAFVLSTAISATLNFIGMKFIVFNKNSNS